MAPLPTLFALLCCIAALVVRCDGVKCKQLIEDKDGKVLHNWNTTVCDAEDHYCMKAACSGEDDSKRITVLSCFPTDDTKECDKEKLASAKHYPFVKDYAPDTWSCKCTMFEKDKDMSNAARLSVKSLMAMPPLLLGIVVPIVRANLLPSY